MFYHSNVSRLALTTVLLGTLANTAPAFAADVPFTAKPPAKAAALENSHKHVHAKMLREHLEEHIKKVHADLKITPEQEPQWAEVAQAMRNDEETTIKTIHDFRYSGKPHTAVEDLENYQKVIQAHIDSLDKVISTFSDLYDSMPDEQKALADKAFSKFEWDSPEHPHHHRRYKEQAKR